MIGAKLNHKQESAIAALLSAPTVAQAATVAGIGEGTLWRWLALPTFQTQYRAARREVVGHAVARLQAACRAAVDTLESVMANGEAAPASRVSAARAVLEMAFKAVELDDLAVRVEALEEAASEGKT